MKTVMSKPPVLWFLFLFNGAVAITAGITVDGTQGIVTSAGMGVVSLGAGAALLARRKKRQLA